MLKRFIIILLSFNMNYSAFGQNGTVWYFGKNAGLDFKLGSPKVIYDGKIDQIEGCSVICDSLGKIVLYSDGQSLWNRSHQIVANGTNLGGHPSASQSGIIIPLPHSNTIYYVFSVDYELNSGGLQYAIVDMARNGGNGEVISKNNLLITPISEKITGALHSNKLFYWIISHEANSDQFISYLLTDTGLVKNPVVSKVGTYYAVSKGQGVIRVNSSNDKIVATDMLEYTIELFDFDNTTGKLSNAIILKNSIYNRVYGAEFSPNGSKLYVSRQNRPSTLFQFDLSNMSKSAIENSRQIVFDIDIDYGLGSIQLAPNGKIYCNHRDYTQPSRFLAEIESPDSLYPLCNFKSNFIDLYPSMSWSGLPNYVSDFNRPYKIRYYYNCERDSFHFIYSGPNDSCLWTIDGDINKPLFGDSIAVKFKQGGLHKVYLNSFFKNKRNIDSIDIHVFEKAELERLKDTTICFNDSLTISITNKYPVFWFDGIYLNSRVFKSQGVYSYQIIDSNGCIFKDTFEIKIVSNAADNRDTFICLNSSLVLPIDTNYNYFNLDSSIQFKNEIKYPDSLIIYEIRSGVCLFRDTFKIDYLDTFGNSITYDTIFCEDDKRFVRASSINGYWQNYSDDLIEIIPSSVPLILRSNLCSVDTIRLNISTLPCACEVFVPNAFTPDYDKLNDDFKPIITCTPENYIFRIYNQWGQKMFESNKPSESWNGMYLNNERNYLNVYFWTLQFIDPYSRSQIIKNGTVTLLR